MLEGWLSQIGARPLQHHAAVEYALGAFAGRPAVPSSASIAAEVNMSQRRFIQLFRAQIGLPPKLFCRIRRFQAVIHATQELDVVDWSDIAEASGYYDQSHFNHEISGVRRPKSHRVSAPSRQGTDRARASDLDLIAGQFLTIPFGG